MTTEQLDNEALNDVEYSTRQVKLQSTPSNIILCTSFKCNMKCIFCLERGNDPDFNIDTYKNLFENKLGDAIKKATHVYYTGWGEFLLFPGIEDFIDHLNSRIPEVTKVFTTNGSPLNQNLVQKMSEGNYTIQISLHASNALLHRLLTQTDYFEQIRKQIEYLVYLKNQRKQSNFFISLIFVVTALNIENLPEFIDFAGELGIDAVSATYITIFKPEHIKLSCFFLKETTNRMFDEAEKRAKRYNLRLDLPPRFGTKEIFKDTEPCRDPWDHIYVDALGNILTCCYAGEPIGNLNNKDFVTIWNGDEYIELRGSLIGGMSHKRCSNCFKFRTFNVGDIRSHITSRRYDQENILKELGLEQKV